MYYNPAPGLAYESINYIINDVAMGRVLRGIHHWGAGDMVVLVFVDDYQLFHRQLQSAPRTDMGGRRGTVFDNSRAWIHRASAPMGPEGIWATVVSTNILRDIPLIGDFITRVILGGDTVSGLTLTRFLSIHMLILPGLLMLCMVLHIYLVRLHGLAEPAESVTSGAKPSQKAPDSIYRFFPEHLFKSAIAFVIVISVVLLLAVVGNVPLEDKVGTIDDSYLPRPEWYDMWLFQLLTFFSGSGEVVGSLALPIVGILILFLMPWLNRSDLRGLAICCWQPPPERHASSVWFISPSWGLPVPPSTGRSFLSSDRQLNASEKAGLRLFADRECAYCHNINGRGGRNQGPDMANIGAKGRTRDWLAEVHKGSPVTIQLDPYAEVRS